MLQLDTFYAVSSAAENLPTLVRELVTFAHQIQDACEKPVLLKLSADIPVELAFDALSESSIGVSLLDSIRSGIPINPKTGRPAFRGVKAFGRCRAAGSVLYPLALLYTQRLGGILSNRLCSGGGIFTANDALGLLASGATCVQVASAVCVYGFDVLRQIVQGVEDAFSDVNGFPRTWLSRTSDTIVALGTVLRCAPENSLCGEALCLKTVMCGRETTECEGCGLCIDICPLQTAYFKETSHEN